MIMFVMIMIKMVMTVTQLGRRKFVTKNMKPKGFSEGMMIIVILIITNI